ncbi:sodium channel protein Nach-like isoform X2 [Rhodnius prolixus]
MVLLSLSGAISLILNSWNRYNANPTVISLEKDYRDWKITFPAATACFLQRLNETAAVELIYDKWGIDENSTEFKEYSLFLNTVANLTYDNLKDFQQFIGNNDLKKMTGDEILEIVKKVTTDMVYRASLYDRKHKDIKFHETLTEMGICYTFAGVVPNYITLKKDPVTTNLNLPYCNYLNSLCYARIEDLPTPVKYYIHSPNEIPDSSHKYFVVYVNMEKDTGFRFQETVASPELRNLDIRQRNCRFVDEPLQGDKIYSYNLCIMRCRKRLAISFCKCLPLFYTKEDGVEICGVTGLTCLSKYRDNIQQLIDRNGKKVECPCLYQCESIVYYLDKDTERTWTYPVPKNIRFRWSIERYSKTRFRRDIIFGVEDLLVSLGGIATFFLGCSVISFVELVYYFSLRLFWYVMSLKKI